MEKWIFNSEDKKAYDDLDSFVPNEVFDAHAHIYRAEDLGIEEESYLKTYDEVGIEVWEQKQRDVFTDRELGALVFPFPTPDCDVKAANEYLIEQLEEQNKKGGNFRGLMLLDPDLGEEYARQCLQCPHIAGFKPYYYYSSIEPKFQSPIEGFLPEWACRLADELGLVITLHMVKDDALFDPENQGFIKQMCRKYTNMKLILAHAARGFFAPNTVKAIEGLRGLKNVWFDSSAVCETAALRAILMQFGPGRLMYGSDFPVSQARDRYVVFGNSFKGCAGGGDGTELIGQRPIKLGLESLRALLQAADEFGLDEADLKDIFHNNAARLLGLMKKPEGATQELYRHAKKIIPSGTQLLSKRPELKAPEQWPGYYKRALGCEVWDIDDKHYYDMECNGIGACLLGYRDPDVTKAVMRKLNMGSKSSLNPPEEVELAQKLCQIHPWAQQARFARTGGETAAVAIRIARATTGRSKIAYSGYHGWHDWYLAGNLGESDETMGKLLPGLSVKGVPVELRGTSIPFVQGTVLDNAGGLLDDFDAMIAKHGEDLAAVVMEPARYHEPAPGYLEHIKQETSKRGIVLIFDEITIGFRRNFGGSHLKFGVNPDMAIFAKSLGNGHPVGAVIGTAAAMDGAQDSFISSTYWTESIGAVAALATIKKHEENDVAGHVDRIGRMVMANWEKYARKHELPVKVLDGFPCLAHFDFVHEKAVELKTLYVQGMLERGFLATNMIYPTLAHTDEIVAMYGDAVDEVFSEIAKIIKGDRIDESLKGPKAHTGFKRLL